MNQTTNIKLTAEISATSKGLVDALNKASAAVNSASGDWKSKFAGLKDSTALVGQSIKNLADLVSQVGKVDMDVDGMERINGAVGEVSAQFAKVQGEVDGFVAKLVEMKNAASDLGMPVEEYQRFSDAVKSSGLSMEEGVQMLQTMRQNIADFANGVPEVTDRFGQLGLTIEQLSSNTVTGNFDAIVQALQSVVQPSEQAKASMEQFKTSMEHAVKVSQEYNKLLVDQTNNAYATDKDVQNAIGLSNAIGRLAGQLSQMKSNGESAANAVHDLTTEEGLAESTLASVTAAQGRFVESLDSVIARLSETRTAYEMLKEYLDTGAVFDPSKIASGESDSFSESVHKIMELLDEESGKIVQVADLQSRLGAPIDTQYIETYRTHVEQLSAAFEEMRGRFMDEQLKLNADEDGFERLKQAIYGIGAILDELSDKTAASTSTLEQFGEANRRLEISKGFEEAKWRVEELDTVLRKVEEQMRKTGRLSMRKEEFEEIRKELSLIAGTDWKIAVDSSDVDEVTRKAEQLKRKAEEINARLGRTPSIWRQIANAVRELWQNIRGANKETEGTGAILQRIGGQLLGMGSKVAIIVKGFREAGKIIGEAMARWFTRVAEEARKLQSILSSSWTNTAEANQRRFENLEKDILKYMEILRKLREGGSATDRNELRMLGRDISNKYGVDLTPETAEQQLPELFRWTHNSRIDALESEIRSLEALNKTLDEEYAERDSYVKNDLGRSIEEKTRGKMRMVEIAREKGANDAKIMELREQLRLLKRETKLEDMYLTERARQQDELLQSRVSEIQNEEIGRYGRGNIDLYNRPRYVNEDGSVSTVSSMSFNENGKEVLIPTIARDARGVVKLSEAEAIARYRHTGEHLGKFDTVEESNAYAERLHEQQEEYLKTLEEAEKRLAQWSNSLSDNDRQKNLRSIMERYSELVESGVSEAQARAVAEQAIAKMLEQEQKDEEQKNKELFDAMQQRIDQYKDAYTAYEQSNKAVYDAQREYAETQRELARQSKREALQRRHESLQRKMSRFGFTPYEGFRLDESETRRMRRKRNVELDAGISEKMERSRAGERVNWSSQERQRILEYQRLERRDKAVQAAMKQMDAASRQKEAAKALSDAAKEITKTMYDQREAFRQMMNSRGELWQAARTPMTRSVNGTPREIMNAAMRNGLNARGVSGAYGTQFQGYGTQFNQLHTDLQDIKNNVWTVK